MEGEKYVAGTFARLSGEIPHYLSCFTHHEIHFFNDVIKKGFFYMRWKKNFQIMCKGVNMLGIWFPVSTHIKKYLQFFFSTGSSLATLPGFWDAISATCALSLLNLS